jgi:2-oxoglutarate/2-oxoacid ferredoxin oxidoreductase subunit beta
MSMKDFDMGGIDMAWCEGCGNFPLLAVVKKALADLSIKPEQLAMVSGIGQAAKAVQYLKCNFFNGLHGRALPPATAIKAVHPGMHVVVESGDGDLYGEGGNHFIHTIRRNPDITCIVHNNMVYALTKGQASPTSEKGYKTPVQINGAMLEPFNPLSVAIALDASFVARANIGDMPQTCEIVKQAMQHKGFSLVDIFQPCVVFNKINTYDWFKENTYYLDKKHNPQDRMAAFAKAIETDKLPLGVFYKSPNKTNPAKDVFPDNLGIHEKTSDAFFKRKTNISALQKLIKGMK